MGTIGEALTARLAWDQSDFDEGIDNAEKKAKGFGTRAKGYFRAATAGALLLATAVTTVGAKVFQLGSEVIETRSKFETTLGSATERTRAFAAEFGSLAGLSQSTAEGLISTTAAIAQGMGFATEASADFAQRVTALAGNLASFNDLPTAEVIMAINAAVTGEREQLKRLGIVINETHVQQQAFALSGKSVASELTQQEKATATLQLITQRAGVAVGDLVRTQDSAANRAKRFRAELLTVAENISAKLAPVIADTLLPRLESALDFIKNNSQALTEFGANVASVSGLLIDVAGTAFKIFGDTLGNIGAIIVGVFTGDWNLAKTAIMDFKDVFTSSIDTVKTSFNQFVQDFEQNSAKVAQGAAGIAEAAGGGGASPDASAIIGGLAATAGAGRRRPTLRRGLAGVRLGENARGETSLQGTTFKLFSDSIPKVRDGLKDVTRLTRIWVGGYQQVSQFSRDIADGVVVIGNNLVSSVTAGVQDMVLGFQSVTDVLKDIGVSIVRDVVGALTKAIAKAVILKGLFGSIFGGPGGLLSGLVPFKHGGMIAARNGFMLPGTQPAVFSRSGGIPILAHAGEAVLTREAVARLGGPRAVNNLNAGSRSIASPSAGTGSGGTVTVGSVELSFPNIRDVRDIERELPGILRNLKRKGSI